MAFEPIDVGASPNDGLGDPIRTAFIKTNTNLGELFAHFQTSPPPTLIGSIGDFTGMIASDPSYFYYCFANYNGISNVWAQVGQIGNITVTAITNGTSNVTVGPNSNVTVGVGGTGNIAVFSSQGIGVAGTVSATGNVTGANLNAITLVSTTAMVATANVTGGNLLTAGIVSAIGNITGEYFIGNGSQQLEIPAQNEPRKRDSEPRFRGSFCKKWSFSGIITSQKMVENCWHRPLSMSTPWKY